MTIMLKETDAVVIGVGWTGSILARELTKAGLNVVGLERGAKRMPGEDFTIPSVRDDLKYAVRQELFQDTQLETVSLRHSPSETALPIRRLGSFLPGTGVVAAPAALVRRPGVLRSRGWGVGAGGGRYGFGVGCGDV